MIIGKAGAGASNGDGNVWEIAKAIADRTWEGVPGGNYSRTVFQDTLAPWDIDLYVTCEGFLDTHRVNH